MYRLKRFAVYLFSFVCLVVGVQMASGEYRFWRETRSWPVTRGTITQLEFRSQPGTRRLLFLIRFEYDVDGIGYTGDVFSPKFDDFEISRFHAERLKRDYRPGMPTAVHYRPADPGHSYIELPQVFDIVWAPGLLVLLGGWILYLLWKTRVRRVPPRLFENVEDPDSIRWHGIYQTVLEKDSLVLQGTAWYPRSPGLTRWPNSRVGLIATPNTIAVIRGPFRASGVLAAMLTIAFEFAISCFVPLIHALAFLREWVRRGLTWQIFKQHARQQADPEAFHSRWHAVEIVSIDKTFIYGYDARTRELWYRLPSRPIDDSITIRADQMERIEQFLAFVRLMQQSRPVVGEETAEPAAG